MHYPVKCRFCGDVIDSEDSLADSMADLRDHIEKYHPHGES